MSYGMTVWDESGNVQMTTDDFTYQIMHSQVYDLAVANPIIVSLPGFDPAKCEATLMPVDGLSETDMGFARHALPWIVQSVGSISISRQTPFGTASTGASLLRFRLIVMRYSN